MRKAGEGAKKTVVIGDIDGRISGKVVRSDPLMKPITVLGRGESHHRALFKMAEERFRNSGDEPTIET